MTEFLTNEAIYIKPVENTVALPGPPCKEIQDFVTKLNLSLPTETDIEEYWEAVKSDNIRVSRVNGTPIVESFMYMVCDYCKTQPENPELDPNDHPIYYCYNCCTDMCYLCHEELVLGKGTPGSRNYKERAAKLSKCKDHHLVRRNLFCVQSLQCEKCDKELSNDVEVYSRRIENKDYCISCVETNPDLINEHALVRWKRINLDDWFEYGSMMDWVPVLRDANYDWILYNYNRDSKYCGTFALMANDNHGRCGFFRWIDPVPKSLDEAVIAICAAIGSRIEDEDLDEDEVKEMPIQILMQCLGMPTYYG